MGMRKSRNRQGTFTAGDLPVKSINESSVAATPASFGGRTGQCDGHSLRSWPRVAEQITVLEHGSSGEFPAALSTCDAIEH